MGQLEHPNIIPVHALIHDDEHGPSMVMKRVEGTNWRELIKAPNHPNWKSGENFSADPLIRNIEVLIEHFDKDGISVNTDSKTIYDIIRSKGYREFEWYTSDCSKCNSQTFKIKFVDKTIK